MIFGNLGNMGEMIKQAQNMQRELKRIKDNLKNARYEVEHSGIKIIVDGEMEIREVKFLSEQDPRKLEENLKNAVNKALKQAKEDAAKQLKSATGGMSIPGLT